MAPSGKLACLNGIVPVDGSMKCRVLSYITKRSGRASGICVMDPVQSTNAGRPSQSFVQFVGGTKVVLSCCVMRIGRAAQ